MVNSHICAHHSYLQHLVTRDYIYKWNTTWLMFRCASSNCLAEAIHIWCKRFWAMCKQIFPWQQSQSPPRSMVLSKYGTFQVIDRVNPRYFPTWSETQKVSLPSRSQLDWQLICTSTQSTEWCQSLHLTQTATRGWRTAGVAYWALVPQKRGTVLLCPIICVPRDFLSLPN